MVSSTVKAGFFCPHETARHAATILGFPSKVCIPSADYESACVIASLASAISVHEPVRLCTARRCLESKVNGPLYVRGVGEPIHRRFALNLRFSEWGRKNDIGDHDRASDGLDWPVMTPEQIEGNGSFARRVHLEGGALAVDGEGTLLATESSIINENRNPGLSKTVIETELHRLLGVEKIIWFHSRKNLDVTDMHVDAQVNFIRPGVVVLSRVPKAWVGVYEDIRDILGKSVDAKGRPFESKGGLFFLNSAIVGEVKRPWYCFRSCALIAWFGQCFCLRFHLLGV
ncbi:hypothetical protein PENPOL_c001G00864 [Penicillium polonicum]|uniref:Uncharacterized protein n=1 Tax=Penicillium polonicum TaxID=60169 RepID=A0A1V6P3N9_PENPO|nr:hypothetical protein PENPOL_c001G00864 [Penicillium polonicum]